ncbi:MAG: hypothetical protein NTW31_05150 [Bacteroidetes bacterium]|nr:hypothetical protein [Bacteroidota bacterium]
MKKIALFLFISFAALATVPVAFSQDSQRAANDPLIKSDANTFLPCSQAAETASILKAAKEQINSFIGDIPVNILPNYGFNNREEFKNVTFDAPFKVYTLKDSNIVFESSWRVPVVIDNEYRALLTVIQINGEYQVADFGARVLAGELFAKKSVQTCGLLRVYELRSDFLIEATAGNQLQFVPVQGPKDKRVVLRDILNMLKNK